MIKYSDTFSPAGSVPTELTQCRCQPHVWRASRTSWTTSSDGILRRSVALGLRRPPRGIGKAVPGPKNISWVGMEGASICIQVFSMGLIIHRYWYPWGPGTYPMDTEGQLYTLYQEWPTTELANSKSRAGRQASKWALQALHKILSRPQQFKIFDFFTHYIIISHIKHGIASL